MSTPLRTPKEWRERLLDGVCCTDDREIIGKALDLVHDGEPVDEVWQALNAILDENESDREYEDAIAALGDDA